MVPNNVLIVQNDKPINCEYNYIDEAIIRKINQQDLYILNLGIPSFTSQFNDQNNVNLKADVYIFGYNIKHKPTESLEAYFLKIKERSSDLLPNRTSAYLN